MTTTTRRYPLWEFLAPPSSFGQPARTAVRAEGTRVLFADGQWRQCGTSGLWNVNLGYGNKRIADAIATSLVDTSYLPLFRAAHQPALDAARAVLEVTGPEHFGRVLFTTSGGTANDVNMKLARQYWVLQGEPGRNLVVGFRKSFHGLTYGSHGLTGENLNQELYGVDRRLLRHVDHEDVTELVDLMSREGDQVAAVVVEPVLGSGAFPLSPHMLSTVDKLRREYGFLLIADEVATGFGRTGPYFASETWPMKPDVLVASKGLTNGTCAAAAVVVSHAVCEVFERADAMLTYGETQAAAPSTCAAIIATIDEMERLEALKRAESVSARLDILLSGLADHPLVAGDRGVGCFRALRLGLDGQELPFPAVIRVASEVRMAGALVQPGPSCVQLIPAFVYEQEDADRLAAAVRAGLDRAAEALAA
jgi:adenosylmethionine-8-amino-7-oxononanoate aminotransferase